VISTNVSTTCCKCAVIALPFLKWCSATLETPDLKKKTDTYSSLTN